MCFAPHNPELDLRSCSSYLYPFPTDLVESSFCYLANLSTLPQIWKCLDRRAFLICQQFHYRFVN